ncbi:MAG TPA: hypothetical protein VNA04_02135 [Thermoanaerobaculia bacterium]|nr:hypothetical protein [Thermoanaerobaculia bacterium]
MLLTALTLVLATAFPSSSKTSWMSPQAFRLSIGMSRAEAVGVLVDSGWRVKPGRNQDQVVVDYGDEKAMTLEFRRNRLHSARFELFAALPEIRAAFEEQKALLQKEHGQPKKSLRSRTVVLYDDRLPNIMMVLSDDPQSDYGKKGIGFLAVRYFNPVDGKP